MTRDEPPRRGEVHLGARRDRDEVQPFGGAAPELAVGMRDQRGAMPDRSQAVHGQQHLVLSAAPGPRRVDVEGEHRSRMPRRSRIRFVCFVFFVTSWTYDRCSSQSFANFRKT